MEEAYLGTPFITSSDQTKYRRMIEETENNYLKGNNKYPNTMTSDYRLLVNYKKNPSNCKSRGVRGDSFALPNIRENDDNECQHYGAVVTLNTNS